MKNYFPETTILTPTQMIAGVAAAGVVATLTLPALATIVLLKKVLHVRTTA